jgi:flagellar biosynthesis protein FlhG
MARPGSADLGDDDVARVIAAARAAPAELVILDVGAGASRNVLDLVLAADVKLCVLIPQLTSLHNAYAMLKACAHRAVHAHAAGDDTAQSLIDSALGSERKARTIAQLLEVLRPLDAGLADRIAATLHGFNLRLVGNQLGNPSDAAMLERIGTMILDHLSIRAPVIATIPSSPTLAGGLRSRTALDATLPPFRRLAAAIVDLEIGPVPAAWPFAAPTSPQARRAV